MTQVPPPVSKALADLPSVHEADAKDGVDLPSLVAAERPMILRGLVGGWPATGAGRAGPKGLNAYLKALDLGAPAPVMEAPAASGGRFGYAADLREFSFSKRQRGLTETLDRIERQVGLPNAPYIAIQMLPIASALPDFARENPMALLPGVSPLLWLGGAVKTQIHNDRNHNLACVISGRRRFLLFPPEQLGNLYIGPLDNPPPLSLVDPEQPDFVRFPRFSKALASASVAELGAGDALFMPRHWWHHVTSRDPYNAMVNYWWGKRAPGLGNPNDCFLGALLALKDLPPGERAYWRAMFEEYVFRADDASVEHIPAPLRGALGVLRPAARDALGRKLKDAVLKGP